eukprot:403334989
MEVKFEAYKKFDWTLNSKWQLYLSNLFPMPPRERLEKLRKKWYRDNIDKEFDLNYEPSAEGSGSQHQHSNGGAQQNGYQQFMNQQQQQNAYPDVNPKYKLYQEVLWLLFILSLPFRLYTGFLAFGALFCGIVRRHGFPKFSQEYLQRIAFDDNFLMFTYMSALTMSSGSMIIYIPLLLTAYVEISPKGLEILNNNPSIPFANYFKDTLSKGAQFKQQFIEMRSDFQVYIGIYLIVVWFIGWSSIIQIFLYWQIMRVQYMMSANIQAAFRRIDLKISGILQNPNIPNVFRNIYMKVKSLMSSMAEQPQPGQPNQGGGGLLSRCNIF